MRIVVTPHDPAWVGKFQRESALVAAALGPWLAKIHHIGSTAIPDIHAKPIIDMLAEVTSLEGADAREALMGGLGYEAKGEYGIPGRRYYRKDGDTGSREFHVHAFLAGSIGARRHLAFRDYLRSHPDLAREYSDLKRRLALEHPDDIFGYMAGKDRFIKECERRALEWVKGPGACSTAGAGGTVGTFRAEASASRTGSTGEPVTADPAGGPPLAAAQGRPPGHPGRHPHPGAACREAGPWPLTRSCRRPSRPTP